MKTLTDVEHREWERTATRPYTSAPLGGATAPRRSRDARLSRLVMGHERPRRHARIIRSPWTGRDYVVRNP